MKNKRENEASSFEVAFEKPFNFAKAVPNPYVHHAREARERQGREERDRAARKQRKPAKAPR